MANARLAPKARVAEKAGRPLPLEMWGPTHMYYMYQSPKAPAMGGPVVELPMDWSARKAATGHHTPVSGLPRELEWPVRKAAGHHPPVAGLPQELEWPVGLPRELEGPVRKAAGPQAPVPEQPALQPAAAEEVVATAQVALASKPNVGGE